MENKIVKKKHLNSLNHVRRRKNVTLKQKIRRPIHHKSRNPIKYKTTRLTNLKPKTSLCVLIFFGILALYLIEFVFVIPSILFLVNKFKLNQKFFRRS